MPSLRQVTSTHVTVIRTISSHPDHSATRSSRALIALLIPSTAFIGASPRLLPESEWSAEGFASYPNEGPRAWSAPRRRPDRAVLLQITRVAPDRVVGAELRIGLPDLLELRVRGRLLRDHLVPGLLQGGHDLGRPHPDLHAVLVLHLAHRLELRRLALGDHVAREVAARLLDDRVLLVGERVPLLLVHVQLEEGGLLMPARKVVELRHLIEAELLVHRRQREFGGVDRAELQRLEDVAGGEE